MPEAMEVMAFEYGTRRIGIAVGNTLMKTAQPLRVISAKNDSARFESIDVLIQEWQPNILVVGQPCHPDGAEHEMTGRARRFGNQLHGRFNLPVEWVDERYTSAILEGNPGMQDNLDSESACLILEQFFCELAEKGRNQKA